MINKKTFVSLMTLYSYNKVSIEPETIIHKYNLDTTELNEIKIKKISTDLGLKTKIIKKEKLNFEKVILPCLVQGKDEEWFVVAKVNDNEILTYNLDESGTKIITHSQFYEIYNSKYIIFKHIDKEMREIVFNIKWFIPTIKKYKTQFIQVLVAALTIQLLNLFTPIVTQVIVDKVLVHNSILTLNTIMTVLAIITIFDLMMNVARTYVFTETTNKVDVILGAKLFNHLMYLPISYYESRRVGDTIARVRELENIRRFLTGTPLSTIIDFLFIVVYIVVMFFYSSTLTYIVLLSLPVFALISLVYTPIFRKRLDEKFQTGAENQAFLVETITGMHTSKSLALEPKKKAKWDSLLSKYTRASYRLSILSGNLNAIISFTQKAFNLVVLWVGVKLVIDHQITVGQLIAFRMLSSNVIMPILRITQLWQEIQQTAVSLDRIGDIFNAKTEINIDESKTRLPAIEGNIKFDGVTFRYRSDKPEVVRNASFDIPKGKIVGIVGRSGSGKSTLGKLVQRLYIPERGKILIDGVDISIVDTEWLRSQIGVVMQESFLFNMTIRENIAVNKQSASIEEIVEVCKTAGAHDFIINLPQAYDTILGENGTGLSGGQKQRIAIARALLNNPKILIFDEATSALDYESENIIQENLAKICNNKTVIMIAHRLSTLKNADLIISMDEGEIVEFGTQQDLLEKKGVYHYLYSQQFSKGGINNV